LDNIFSQSRLVGESCKKLPVSGVYQRSINHFFRAKILKVICVRSTLMSN